MTKCPKCGSIVNASDKRCKKCGTILPYFSSRLLIGIVIVIVIIAIVGAFASGIFTGEETADDSPVETVDAISEDNANDDSSESSVSEYWASSKTDKFHLPDCEWAEKIGDGNKIIYDSREEAIADGKKPCDVCNP